MQLLKFREYNKLATLHDLAVEQVSIRFVRKTSLIFIFLKYLGMNKLFPLGGHAKTYCSYYIASTGLKKKILGRKMKISEILCTKRMESCSTARSHTELPICFTL